MFNELCPLALRGKRRPRVSVTWKIDEIEIAIYPVEVNRLRTTGRITGERQLALSNERIDKAGLTDVTSPKKCHFRQSVGGELSGIVNAFDEFCFQVYYNQAGDFRGKNAVTSYLQSTTNTNLRP